jgi:hypothetical protein
MLWTLTFKMRIAKLLGEIDLFITQTVIPTPPLRKSGS